LPKKGISATRNRLARGFHVGAGYRVYVKQKDAVVYVLLTGGSKSTQKKDIETALKMAQELGD
jgi:putative addiction module killer protein